MELPLKIKEYKDVLKPKLMDYIEIIKKRKILILPLIIVFLLVFTVLLSMSQTEKQKNVQPNIVINPQETIVPVPTGSSIISRAGIFKAVKYGTSTEFFIVLRNGDALKLEIPNSINPLPYYNKNVFVSGILNEGNTIIKVENITEYEAESDNDEYFDTPVPYPNMSPLPTPSDLPLSSPISE